MSKVEQHSFQAEVQQLLNIVIHSLYTDKEIFVRELISNASDALERLRFQQVSGAEIFDKDLELGISVKTSSEDKTLIIEDTGSGMTHDELVKNLGTIAHSGSKAFLEKLKEQKDAKGGVDLIGQFGVGFYSAFMAAKEVSVYTRSWKDGESGWVWKSTGEGSYSIEEEKGLRRGTKIVVSLKDDEKEFAEDYRVEGIIKQYSNYVSFPIELNGKSVNTVQAIWMRSKSELKEEDYHSFYKYMGHDQEEPHYYLHFSADAPLAIQSLLYVPKKNIESMGMNRVEPQVSLYCRKILIEQGCKTLLPEWMRFVKGVVDSEDLPLNISRESMQDSSLMQKLGKVVTKRFLKFLDEESRKRSEKFEEFYKEFSPCLKEGVVSDFANKEALSKLLRFESSATEAGKLTTLKEYVERMPSDQAEILYVSGANRASAEASAYYEGFKKKGWEVLFLLDPMDEFVMDHLQEFDGKKVKSAEKAELEVDVEGKLSDEESRMLANFMKETLGDRVHEVKVSKRLVDSPAMVIDTDEYMTASMRQMLRRMNKEGEAGPGMKLNLEINPGHGMMVKLHTARGNSQELAEKVVEQVWDSCLAAAGLLEDPRKMLSRMNDLIEEALEKK